MAWVASGYAIVGGAITLVGWAWDWPRLTDWKNDGISMFPNTAFCAILSGVALILLTIVEGMRWRIGIRVLAVGVAVVSGLTFFQHISGMNLGIDTLLFDKPWGQTHAATAPMRMGPPASTSFLILGTALLLATARSKGLQVASGLALLPIAIAALSFVGFWYGADQLFGVARFTGIAWQTSTILAALGIATVAAIPEHGVGKALLRNDAGSAVLWLLILPVILVPLVLGWLRIWGQQAGLYDMAFGTAIRSLLEVAFFLALLWWTSKSISQTAAAAQSAQGLLAEIVASSGDAIVSESLEGVIQSWNAGAERLFGYSSQEAIGRNIRLIIPSDRSDEDAQLLMQLRQGERVAHFDTVRVRKDGSRINVSLTFSPVHDAQGNIVGASKLPTTSRSGNRMRRCCNAARPNCASRPAF